MTTLLDPYLNPADKVTTVDQAKEDKLNRLSSLDFETVELSNAYDADSLRFKDVYGGLGGTTDEGVTYDRTGQLSNDRFLGLDTYEVFPSSEDTYNYLYNDPRGQEKMARQRASLADRRGVSVDTISNEDVFEEGAKGLVQEMALAQAYDKRDQARGNEEAFAAADAYLQQVAAWEPSPELTKQWRTSAPVFGTAEEPLSVRFERAFTGEYDYYGRPLTYVRPVGSEYLFGEERAGYTYDFDDKPARRPTLSVEELVETAQRLEAEGMGVSDRLVNAFKAFGKTFTKEAGVDLADWVGEGLNYLTDGKVGWDIGDEEYKTTLVNELWGFNPYAAEEDLNRAQELGANIVDAVMDKDTDVDYNDVLELVKIGFTTPELLGDSLGFITSFFVPFLGWGGKAAKADKTIRATQAALKAGKISKATAKANVIAAKADVSILNAVAGFAKRNAGLMQVSAGNVNDQIDAYRVEHGEDPSIGKITQMLVIETMLLSLDRMTDMSILKAPFSFSGAGKAFDILPKTGKAAILSKVLVGAAKVATNTGKEAAQEYVQEIGQEFNVKFNFDDNTGEFLSAETLGEVKEVLLDRDMQITGVVGAGLGAGGAGQFSAVGAVGGVFGKGRSAVSDLKDSPTPRLPSTEVTDEEVSPEVVAERERAAITTSSDIARKYADLLKDEELEALRAATRGSEVDAVETPSLQEILSQDPDNHSKSLEEIERAEAIIEGMAEAGRGPEDAVIHLKVLRKAKQQILSSVMQQEEGITLGSNYTPEDVITDYLDTVEVRDGELSLSAEENSVLTAYAEKNDIPPMRFETLKSYRTGAKDPYAVHDEAHGEGPRSTSNYNRRLRNLVNNPNPSRRLTAKLVDDLDNFHLSQENRKAAFDSVAKDIQAEINKYNKRLEDGESPSSASMIALRTSAQRDREIPGYPNNFINVLTNTSTGKLEIHHNSKAILQSLDDTLATIDRIRKRYRPQVLKILGDVYEDVDAGISIRPHAKHQEVRNNDDKFYKKRGVTKAIIGDEANAVWSPEGDYAKDNASLINTGEYTENDVVVLHANSTTFGKGNKIREEINKAYVAGATIIIDRAIATGKTDKGKKVRSALAKLLSNYHFSEVTVDGITKYVREDVAKLIRDDQKETKKTKKKKTKNLKALVKAIESGDQKTADTIIKEEFEGDKSKASSFYNNLVESKTKKLTEDLVQISLNYGPNSEELSEAMATASNQAKRGEIPSLAVNNAFEAVEKELENLEKGEVLLQDWNEAKKAANKGELDYSEWLKNNVPNPMHIVKDMLDNAVAVGKRKVYVYYDNTKKDFSRITTNITKIPEGVAYQVLELDASNYVTVSTTTPINSLDVRNLRIAGRENIAFNQVIDTAKQMLLRVISEPNLDYKGTKHGITSFTNSPVSSLIFDKDLEVNANVAIAVKFALNNFIKNSGYLLSKGKKSKADIAEILGIDESHISRDAVFMMQDKGLLYKTAANSIGKDIAGMLGLARKSGSDADAQAYDALIADLGQTALMMGVEEGLLALDNSLSASKFAKVVLSKPVTGSISDSGPKVLFIQAAPNKEDDLTFVADQAKRVSEIIPDTDSNRKEPLFKKPDNKVMDKASKGVRKEMFGIKIPKRAINAMKKLMSTEWSADLVLMKEFVKDKELIKERLGYIDTSSDKYEQLSHKEKEAQESVNRGIDRSFEEMEWLLDNNEGDRASMWFEYFFSKNGRFFIDSNTLNPQTDKHLHRFAIQPASHINKFTVVRGKFKIGQKDVTDNVHYALSQAFGFSTDKKNTRKGREFGKLIVSKLNTKNKIKAAKEELLKNGVYVLTEKTVDGKKVPDQVIEIEHLGHALVGFKFLEDRLSGGKAGFTSSLTAEFDAVTSGFGIKLLQLPIIKSVDSWLKKVGVVLNDDPSLVDAEAASMNDLLDSGQVLDSYQSLASLIKQSSFKEMLANLGKTNVAVSKTGYNENLWNALSEVLPQVEAEGVSSALRNLFKYPFMLFNYSASIKAIRENLLVDELLGDITKKMAAADIKDKNDPIVKLMVAFAGKKGISKLQKDIRSKPLYSIKSSTKAKFSLEQYLGQMINASYGAQVEAILTKQFKEFIKAQEKINTAFKAMFEVFIVAFEQELEKARKEGAVSVEKERAIYEKLKNQWPMIKGPLSAMEKDLVGDDGVVIYDTQTASPYGIYSGRKPARINLSKEMQKKLGQQEVRVSHMVKQMVAATAAGSVIPIHYIDGAIMAETVNGLSEEGVEGITTIHDAIIPPLLHMDKAQMEYNKQTMLVNTSYSFINELMTTLDRFMDEAPLGDPIYQRRKVVDGKKEVSVREYLLNARNAFSKLTNDVNLGREKLFNNLNKGGKIMHMAGTPEGVYDIIPDSVSFEPVDKVPHRDLSTIKRKKETVADVRKTAKTLKC